MGTLAAGPTSEGDGAATLLERWGAEACGYRGVSGGLVVVSRGYRALLHTTAEQLQCQKDTLVMVA